MTRGGPRPGAGRPVTTGRQPRVYAVASEALLARLRAVLDPGEAQAALVAAAIVAEVERREREEFRALADYQRNRTRDP